jgi:hypothetical protein
MDIAKKRKQATALLLERIGMLDKFTDAKNVDRWRNLLNSLSDTAFHQFMLGLRDNKHVIYIYLPNMEKHPSMDDLYTVADKLGVSVFERIFIRDELTGRKFLTPESHLVVRIPIRRMQQYGDHKMSMPEGDTRVDSMTGQVIHDDRAAGITNPEIQALMAKGLNKLAYEVVAIRGGNIDAWQSGFKRQAEETGEIIMDDIPKDSKNRTVVIGQILLEGLHLENNIAEM